MAENKTKATRASVTAFLNKIKDSQLRDDCFALLEMMHKVTNLPATMWGGAIIGFGKYHYVYESGREGDSLLMGFAPRKQNITIYLTGGLDKIQAELRNLGKYKTGKGCLYIRALGDVNAAVLKKILSKAFRQASVKHPHSG